MRESSDESKRRKLTRRAFMGSAIAGAFALPWVSAMPNTAQHLEGPKKGGPIGKPERAGMSDDERKMFYKLRRKVDADYVGNADNLALCDLAVLAVRMEKGTAELSDERAFRNYLDSFGLTPAGRKALLRASNAANKVQRHQNKFKRTKADA